MSTMRSETTTRPWNTRNQGCHQPAKTRKEQGCRPRSIPTTEQENMSIYSKESDEETHRNLMGQPQHNGHSEQRTDLDRCADANELHGRRHAAGEFLPDRISKTHLTWLYTNIHTLRHHPLPTTISTLPPHRLPDE